MDVPNSLRLGIELAHRGFGQAELAAAATQLSARYRAGHGAAAGPPAGHYVADALAAAAYAVYRMSATYAASAATLGELAARFPGWAPRSLLDVGAGLGAVLWAATTTWDRIASADLVEVSPAMLALGRQLAAHSSHPALTTAHWLQSDLAGAWPSQRHDLVTAAYVLGELSATLRTTLVDRLWAQSQHALVLIEPGTPTGWAIIHAAREQLRHAGASIVAPCPQQGTCPLPADDWCHFAQRVARSKAQRVVKGAELGYEDEKFAYIAVARTPSAPIAARVIRRPLARPGRIELALCTPMGLRTSLVTRTDRARWREARDVMWGETFGF